MALLSASYDVAYSVLVIYYLSYEHGTDFHLHHLAEDGGCYRAVLALISYKHRILLECNGAYGMEHAFKLAAFAFRAGVNVAVTVVVVYAEPVDEAHAAFKFLGKLGVLKQGRDAVCALLYGDDGVLIDPVSRKKPVAGGYESVGSGIYGTEALFDSPCEEIVKATYAVELVLVRVDVVVSYKGFYQALRKARVQESSA